MALKNLIEYMEKGIEIYQYSIRELSGLNYGSVRLREKILNDCFFNLSLQNKDWARLDKVAKNLVVLVSDSKIDFQWISKKGKVIGQKAIRLNVEVETMSENFEEFADMSEYESFADSFSNLDDKEIDIIKERFKKVGIRIECE